MVKKHLDFLYESNSYEKKLKKLFEEEEVVSSGGQRPELVFLIGPPGVGKTEYIKTNYSGYEVLNRDDIVEKVAKTMGIGTYDDMFAQPGNELKQELGESPTKEEIDLAFKGEDEMATKKVGEYLEKAKRIASSQPAHKNYGEVESFDLGELYTVAVKYGVPTKFISPFKYSKIGLANAEIASMFSKQRSDFVRGKKSFVIDMTNMNRASRDSHRKDIMAALGKENEDIRELSNYFKQVAVVFAPEGGYGEEDKEKIKLVGKKRGEQIKMMGGSKTIPDAAYDRMFSSFEAPSQGEGFEEIKYVGMPSLKMLSETFLRFYSLSMKKSFL